MYKDGQVFGYQANTQSQKTLKINYSALIFMQNASISLAYPHVFLFLRGIRFLMGNIEGAEYKIRDMWLTHSQSGLPRKQYLGLLIHEWWTKLFYIWKRKWGFVVFFIFLWYGNSRDFVFLSWGSHIFYSNWK